MKVFVLTINKDLHRRNLLRGFFPYFYDNFIFFYGFSNINKITRYPIKNNNMTDSEILCALSHIEILKQLVTIDCKSALILEDDIEGSDESICKVFKIYNELPVGSVLIAGGHEGVKAFQNLYGFEYLTGVFRIPKIYYRYLSRACCYVVTKNVACEIIKKQDEKLVVADQWDILLSNVDNVYYTSILKHPNCLQSSNIEAERQNKRGKNILISIFREGILKSIYYFLRKKITKFIAIINGYKRVVK